MKTKDYVKKAWIFCLIVFPAALILMVSPYMSEGAVVEVDTIEELYAEFYNPNNMGDTIELAPGTYVLNSAGPNQGRLVFGPLTPNAIKGQNEYFDVDLDGVPDPRDDNGDGEVDLDPAGRKIFAKPATETIIDGTSLLLTPVNTFGFIEMRALVNSTGTSQSVSNLTLRGNNRARSALYIDGMENSTLDAKVTGCIIQDSPRGIRIDARAITPMTPEVPSGQNAEINVIAEGNVIRNSGKNNLPQINFGWGIQLQSSTSGNKFSVLIRHNRLYENRLGLFLEPLGMDDGTMDVLSQGNIYEDSVLATNPAVVPGRYIFSAGIAILVRDFRAFPPFRGTHRNRFHLSSHEDAIWNNVGWGGLLIIAVNRTVPNTDFLNNEIDVELIGTRFVKLNEDGTFDGPQNQEARLDLGKTIEEQPVLRQDIIIMGAENSGTNFRDPPEDLPGTASGNRVNFLLRQAMSSLMPTDYDASPEPIKIEDNAPDQVDITIVGSLNAFDHTNTSFNLPDESLFESKGGKTNN